jgi:hypothetical protein
LVEKTFKRFSLENEKIKEYLLIQKKTRMENPEKTEEAIKNGQSRKNRRGYQEWTI